MASTSRLSQSLWNAEAKRNWTPMSKYRYIHNATLDGKQDEWRVAWNNGSGYVALAGPFKTQEEAQDVVNAHHNAMIDAETVRRLVEELDSAIYDATLLEVTR